jgi:two-component system, chemotaxis family, response regulator Rcp1
MPQPKLHILLVEDNPADVLLLRESLRQVQVPWTLDVATDGEQAIQFLSSGASGACRPDLILLDLNLPRKSGREVLKELKRTDSELRGIPVIILSTSRDCEDVRTAYELFANCYVSKPHDLDDYFDVVRRIEEFWHQRAELPSGHRR